MEILLYAKENGKEPFSEWLEALKDLKARSKIRTRLDRLFLGNFGDTKSLKGGLFELRINYGPGYRVYFGQRGSMLILLLLGGDKSSQSDDIKKASCYWQEYLFYENKKKI